VTTEHQPDAPTSPDGLWRWSGTEWVPTAGPPDPASRVVLPAADYGAPKGVLHPQPSARGGHAQPPPRSRLSSRVACPRRGLGAPWLRGRDSESPSSRSPRQTSRTNRAHQTRFLPPRTVPVSRRPMRPRPIVGTGVRASHDPGWTCAPRPSLASPLGLVGTGTVGRGVCPSPGAMTGGRPAHLVRTMLAEVVPRYPNLGLTSTR
jgi:hypothetical protein